MEKVFCNDCGTRFEVDYLKKNYGDVVLSNSKAFCPKCGSMDLYPDTKEGADKSIATLTAYENDCLDIDLSELETEEAYNAFDE